MPQEGQTARGPNGQVAVYRNGQWVVQSQAQQPPADPTFEYQAPRAQADLQSTQVQTQGSQIDNEVAAGTAPTTIQTNEAPAGYIWIDPSDPTKGVQPIPGYTPSSGKNVLYPQKLADMRSLQNLLDDLQEKYKAGPGSTGAARGFMDYLPTDANMQFDTLAASLGDVGFAAFRVPGSGTQTDADQKRFLDANTPSAGDRDVVIQQKLANVQNRLDETIRAFGMTQEEFRGTARPEGGVFDQMYAGQAPEAEAAGFGAETRSVPLPEGYQSETNSLVARLLSENNGRVPVDEYAREMVAIERKYEREIAALRGSESLNIDSERYKDWARGYNEYLDAGGKKVPPAPSTIEVPLSDLEKIQNNIVANPVGAAGSGYLNAASGGAFHSLFPDQGALAENYPLSSLMGEIGGAVTGTAALGKLGGAAASRFAPSVLGGGAKAQFGRNLATDGVYSGIYSANSGENVGIGTGLGVGGSILGQALGKGIGAGIGGVKRSAPVQDLLNRGVPLTVGRQLGDAGSRFEDLMQSVPFVGGKVRKRMGESFEGLEQAAMREAGEPIGFTPNRGGLEGLQDLRNARSDFYTETLNGVEVPLGEEFVQDMSPVADIASNLSAGNRRKLVATIEDAVQIPADAGSITGQQYQDALVALKRLRNKPGEAMPNAARSMQDAATQSITALDNAITRGAGPGVVEGRRAADQSNRFYKTLEDAMNRAAGGSQTGEIFLPTPSQLQRAGIATQKKYPGPRPFQELADSGQRVLPQTVPNSGTTDRALAASALGALGIGASGIGINDAGMSYDSGNAQGAAGLLAALTLFGTKRGQQALTKVIFERPTVAQQVGNAISRRSGLFGSGARQYALQGQ